jgi:hypothetical protein
VQVELAKAEAEGDALTIETAELTAQVKAAQDRAEASEQARAAAERAHAEAAVSVVALSEQLEALEADATARRSLGRLARLRAAWRGE